VRPGLPTTAIDIVSYRPAGLDATWESEPIVDPIEIQSGGWALLPSAVLGRAPAYDVVMAWTVRHPDGDVPGSASFLVTEQEGAVAPEAAVDSPREWVAAAVVLILLLAAAGAFVAAELVDALGEDEQSVETASVTTAAVPSTGPGSAGTTVPAPTTTPATAPTTTPTTGPTTTRPATTTTTSTSTSTSTTSTSTTTSTTSTTSSTISTSSTTVPVGPRVLVEGRVEDCRFGADCLIVGFVIEEFDSPPNEYVCEFGDGSRTTFRFGGSTVETACSQSGLDPSITVEVAGIRSETLTRDDVT
jgi:hypothetical protein